MGFWLITYPVGESMKHSETLVISFPYWQEVEEEVRLQPRPEHTTHCNLAHAATSSARRMRLGTFLH
jgi:hypothetical protein